MNLSKNNIIKYIFKTIFEPNIFSKLFLDYKIIALIRIACMTTFNIKI